MQAGDRLKAIARDQIASIARKHSQLLKKDLFTQFGGGPLPDNYSEFSAMCLAAIDRLTARHDCYYEQAVREIDRHNTLTSPELAHSLYGLVQAVERDIEGGSLITLREVEHAKIFGDLLDLAEWRARRGSHEAAAHIMGAVLETHLRQMAVKYAIRMPAAASSSDRPRIRPQHLNNDLAQVAYGEPERQNVADWLAFTEMPTTSRERIAECAQDAQLHREVPSLMSETTFGARILRIRVGCNLTQSEFADLVQQAGEELREPNSCSKQLVQKWESELHKSCRPNYRRALHRATGISYFMLEISSRHHTAEADS